MVLGCRQYDDVYNGQRNQDTHNHQQEFQETERQIDTWSILEKLFEVTNEGVLLF